MDVFFLFVWYGGANKSLDKGYGIWRSIFWPYYLGQFLVLHFTLKPDPAP